MAKANANTEVKEEVKAEVKATKKWEVKVKNNPEFVGIGAGGVQFSYGKAIITSERMAAWFKEHEGYEVSEVK